MMPRTDPIMKKIVRMTLRRMMIRPILSIHFITPVWLIALSVKPIWIDQKHEKNEIESH